MKSERSREPDHIALQITMRTLNFTLNETQTAEDFKQCGDII